MSNRPTGTVTFLFTDIEGSTRRWEHNSAEMQPAHARQEESFAMLSRPTGAMPIR